MVFLVMTLHLPSFLRNLDESLIPIYVINVIKYLGSNYLYENIRRSHDCIILGKLVYLEFCQFLASFSSFWAAVTMCT